MTIPPDLTERLELAALRAMSPECMLSAKEAAALAGISTSRLYELVGAGTFPSPRRLGGRRRGWLRSEVMGWMIEQPVVIGYRQNGRKKRRRG